MDTTKGHEQAQTFTIAALPGQIYPQVQTPVLVPGAWKIRLVEHGSDAQWNAYRRGPSAPFSNLLRIHDGAYHAGLSATGVATAHNGLTVEFGGFGMATWQDAIAKFGTRDFVLKGSRPRSVMIFIYVGLDAVHSGGLTVQLQRA